MALRAGRLRQEVVLLREITTKNADGDAESAWTPEGGPIPAEVIGIALRETMIGQALQGNLAYKITIRWRDDITAADQLGYGVRTLNITADPFDPDGRREQLVILASTASALAPAS